MATGKAEVVPQSGKIDAGLNGARHVTRRNRAALFAGDSGQP
jgi:hypothetical protein